jgi:hypothetical protein
MKRGLLVYLAVCINLTLLNGQAVTYFNDVTYIFSRNCTSCHKQDGIAPFALENLDQVIPHKSIILSVLNKGIMPPWRPDPEYSHFINERILSPSDKQKIISWIREGCQPGAPTTGEVAPQKDPGKDHSGELIFKLPYTIKILAGNTDTNVWVEMPYELEKDTFVSSYEFVPAHNSGIHHAMISIQNAVDIVAESDVEDILEGTFWDGRAFHERSFSSKYLAFMGGWVPGQSELTMPSNMGWRLPKRGILLYQLHYGPSPVTFISNFYLRFNYSKGKAERTAVAQKYGSQSRRSQPYPPLVIPPDSVMMFTLSGPIDFDCSIIAVSPHMHLLGKSFKSWLLKSNGDTVRLINIKDWDFTQQGFYYLPTLTRAEKGDMLQFEAVLDNTVANIRNPNKPPKLVKSGPDTKDEMIQMSILVVCYHKGDETLSAKSDN